MAWRRPLLAVSVRGLEVAGTPAFIAPEMFEGVMSALGDGAVVRPARR